MHVRKVNPDGSIRYKARLVARGFTQVAGENFDWNATFAPVLKLTTLRWIFSLIAQYDLDASAADVTQAFLQADLYTESEREHFKDIIIELPPGLEYECPTTGRKLQYARLNKALYGLIQAPHRWNKTFHAYLIDIGFTQHPQDPCLYYIIQGKDFMILGNYVDDLIKVTNCTKLREQIDKLLEARFKITHQGVLTEFIGLQCGWRESGGGRYFQVHQGKYLDKILTRFGMSNCNSVS